MLIETVELKLCLERLKKGYDNKKLAKKWAKHPPLGQNTGDAKSDLIEIVPKLFKGICRLPGEYKIELRPDAKLIHLPVRNILETLKEPPEKELNRMWDLHAIGKVTEDTDWCQIMCML